MERTHGTHKSSSKLAREDDVISSMPENVVTDILDRLSIKEAVGTSILSRNWRFKWTLLTKLLFDIEYHDERDLSRLLLQLKGPITKFTLLIPNHKVLDVKDINHWIMFLSTKGIKEFTLINNHNVPLKLPSHLFSCLELKHLKIRNCCFRVPPTLRDFPNLLTLDLFCVAFESDNCGQLITRCPLLEILNLSSYNFFEKLKLAEIAQLGNIRVLYLPLCELDYTATSSRSIILHLGSCLPKLQELNLDFQNCTFIRGTDARCDVFPCLKTLTLSKINLYSRGMVELVFDMICGSPYLQTLNITATYPFGVVSHISSRLATTR